MLGVSLLQIGDLARLGGVTVRMLRHYHEIGLLVPSDVDDATGYRRYDFDQLKTLRRIVELKNLGLSLAEVDLIVNGPADADAFRQMLHIQRNDVLEEIANAEATVRAIDHELALIDRTEAIGLTKPLENAMPTNDLIVELKPVPPRLVAQISAVAATWHPADIGPVIQGLYPQLFAALSKAGEDVSGITMAWYDDSGDDQVNVHATVELERSTADRLLALTDIGFEVVELPPVDQVAATHHHGSMENCYVTYEALLSWIGDNGFQSVGQFSREIDLECGPDGPVLTEIQIPVTAT